jgi:HTH-type transcriptional regulator/antitoxin HigA
VQSPGDLFKTLCEIFPLKPITRQDQHKIGLKVITDLSEYFSRIRAKLAQKKEILQYIDTLGLLIANYETKFLDKKSKEILGSEILEFLMEEHNLVHADLSQELGGQSVVSEILSGNRELNKNQIKSLSERFGVSPAVFL